MGGIEARLHPVHVGLKASEIENCKSLFANQKVKENPKHLLKSKSTSPVILRFYK